MNEQNREVNISAPSQERHTNEPQKLSGATCSRNFSAAQLRQYILAEKESASPDPAIGEHLAAGCSACNLQRRLLFATNPYLREKADFGAVHVEEIPSETDEIEGGSSPSESTLADPSAAGSRGPVRRPSAAESDSRSDTLGQLKQEVSQKLSRLIATPAEPLSISQLRQMDEDLRSGQDAAREWEVQRIVKTCDRRWARLHPDLHEQVEQAAGHVMTAVSGGETFLNRGGIIAELQVEPNGHLLRMRVDSKRSASAVLMYLMSRTWFLNPGGERLWEVQESGTEQPIWLSLDLNLLRKSLASNSTPAVPSLSD